MKKCMKTALILVLIAACLVTTALAAEPTVTYSGNSGNFVFAPEDLFADFKGVMPGDKLTETIEVKNNANNKVDVKIYMRALGATGGTENYEEFLNQMKLTVTQTGGNTLFEAQADETAQLTNWKPLGTFKSGAKVTLDVQLEVPIEMGNEFQDAVGELQWEFYVEEFPVKEGPATGDETPLALYGAIAGVCVLGLLLLLATRKKREEA